MKSSFPDLISIENNFNMIEKVIKPNNIIPWTIFNTDDLMLM